MVLFPCHVCRTLLSAEDAQSGQLVRCPTCLTTLRVPAAAVAQPAPAMAGVGAGAGAGASTGQAGAWPAPPARSTYGATAAVPRPSVGKRHGVDCGYCSSR